MSRANLLTSRRTAASRDAKGNRRITRRFPKYNRFVAQSTSYLPATSVAWLRIFQTKFGNRPSSNISTVDTISVAFIEGGVTIGSAEFAGFIHMALRKRR